MADEGGAGRWKMEVVNKGARTALVPRENLVTARQVVRVDILDRGTSEWIRNVCLK